MDTFRLNEIPTRSKSSIAIPCLIMTCRLGTQLRSIKFLCTHAHNLPHPPYPPRTCTHPILTLPTVTHPILDWNTEFLCFFHWFWPWKFIPTMMNVFGGIPHPFIVYIKTVHASLFLQSSKPTFLNYLGLAVLYTFLVHPIWELRFLSLTLVLTILEL